MVVLEGSGGVVTIGNNQYLQPDYLAPMSTTMDAKKSPLAMLAQTCSQIGADSSAVKPLLSMDKSKKSTSTSSASSSSGSSTSAASTTPAPTTLHALEMRSVKSPSQARSPKSTTPTMSDVKLAFKPYEANVLSHQNQNTFKSNVSTSYNEEIQQQQQRPSSKSSSHGGGEGRAPSRNKSNGTAETSKIGSSTSTDSHDGATAAARTTPNDNNRKTVSPSGSSQRGASPIVRSGMEVLNNVNGSATHPKEMSSVAAAAAAAYKAAGGPFGMSPLSSLCCPPGMEQHGNPAFRSPFNGAFVSHQHAALLAAAAANAGYHGAGGGPNGAPGATSNPYFPYQRVKTPGGVDAVMCKDPYCSNCIYAAHTHQMMTGAQCPAGCTQCEHQKYSLAMMSAAAAGALPPQHPYSQAAAAAVANAAAARSAPYVCSWVVGDSYCGKRFQTSDELFTHLRTTHTGNLNDPSAAAAALAQSQTQSLIGSLFPPGHLRGGYATPPLSPMSAAAAAARYHPYAKPGGLPPGVLAGGPPPFGAGGAFNPAAAAAVALGPYYSPYAMYGQRIGSAAVHQ